MSEIGQLKQAARFAYGVYRWRAGVAYNGHVRRDPVATLMLSAARRTPYPTYERLRAEGPLNPASGGYATTSHALSNRVLRDRSFGVAPADAPAEGAVDEVTGAVDLSFLGLNPPDHTRLRRLVSPAFSPKRMAAYTAPINEILEGIVSRLPRGEPFDFVADFAAPFPIAVITALLGVPSDRVAEFVSWGATYGSAIDGVTSLRHGRALMAAKAGLTALFADLFELRRSDPADDVVSTIVASEGDQVQPHEMMPLVDLLLIAGFETTVNLISNGVLALHQHPAQWAALQADPSLASGVTEETLRWDPPVQRTLRFALSDTEVEGRPVRKGQWVAPLIGGANRDPDVYADPQRYDITREPAVEHLAFSSGIHYCIGQPLARLEATAAFGLIAGRLPDLRMVGPIQRRRATTIRGPLHMPVQIG